MNSSALANNNIEPGLLEQQNKERKFVAQQARDNIRRRPDGHAISRQLRVEYPAVVDIEPQLMQLEHQRKKQELVEQEERDVTGGGRDSQAMSDFQQFRREERPGVEYPQLQDYGLQIKLPEQESKRRKLMAQKLQDIIGGRRDSQDMSGLQPAKSEEQPRVKSQARTVAELQLELIRQHHKGLELKAQGRDVIGGMGDSQAMSDFQPVTPKEQPSVKDQALAVYQNQLILLEEQNKGRLIMAPSNAGS